MSAARRHGFGGVAPWSLAAWGACAAAGALSWAAGGGLPPPETRGQEIYVRGVSTSGSAVTARMGEGGAVVPAAMLPCVNCHGADGRGKPEGGVTPTNIAWPALTKPYGVRRSGGRNEPPYDPRLLTRAIAMGIDSGGGELHAAMPRYQMTREDMEDLIAYLRVIGSGQDPGLSPDRIRIGTLLPRQGAFAARGAVMQAALEAYFADLNERGGIYNRRIELRIGEAHATSGDAAAAARAFLEQEAPFALTSVFMAGAERGISSLAGEAGIPLVGALTVNPPNDSGANRHVFYLDGGLEGQWRALIGFASRPQGEGGRVLSIVARQDATLDGVIEALEEHARTRGWGDVRTIRIAAEGFDPPGLVRKMRDEGTDAILLLASGEPEKALLDEAARIGWPPKVLIPGLAAGDEVFDVSEGAGPRIFLAFPTLPSDRTLAGRQEYDRLSRKYDLPGEFPMAQLTALTSARILVEGLKRAGGELSREALLAALEGLRNFDTQLTPQVSYGPNRRVGITGAHIVSIDPAAKTLVPVTQWVEPE